jgi:hypothetical protein
MHLIESALKREATSSRRPIDAFSSSPRTRLLLVSFRPILLTWSVSKSPTIFSSFSNHLSDLINTIRRFVVPILDEYFGVNWINVVFNRERERERDFTELSSVFSIALERTSLSRGHLQLESHFAHS